MKDHYIDIKLYTSLTIHVVSNNSNGSLTKTYGPYRTLHSNKDHSIDIKHYTPLAIQLLYQIILIVVWPKLTVLTVLYIL